MYTAMAIAKPATVSRIGDRLPRIQAVNGRKTPVATM